MFRKCRGPADPHGFHWSASPMDTWTAERTFARNSIESHSLQNNIAGFPIRQRIETLYADLIWLRAAIHSAVRVSTGEADEIAAQSPCGFCGLNKATFTW
jgi:hypothetical protein